MVSLDWMCHLKECLSWLQGFGCIMAVCESKSVLLAAAPVHVCSVPHQPLAWVLRRLLQVSMTVNHWFEAAMLETAASEASHKFVKDN